MAAGLLVGSAHAQLTLNDTYSIRSDPNNGRLGQRWERIQVEPEVISEPSGIFLYSPVTTVPIRADGSGVPTGQTGLGRRFNAGIFYFQLPELGSGLSIGNASLEFTFLSAPVAGVGDGSVDLWGLGYSSTPSIPEADWPKYWHADETDTTEAMGMGPESVVKKIQNDIISKEAVPANDSRFSTDETGSALLSGFLNDLYAAGAQPGDYAVFRLSYDNVYDANALILGYNVAGSGATEAATDPTLSFTVIPESSTVAFLSGLAALAAAGFVRHRRRQA